MKNVRKTRLGMLLFVAILALFAVGGETVKAFSFDSSGQMYDYSTDVVYYVYSNTATGNDSSIVEIDSSYIPYPYGETIADFESTFSMSFDDTVWYEIPYDYEQLCVDEGFEQCSAVATGMAVWPITDVCSNLEGVQTEIPEGYEDPEEEGVCVLVAVPSPEEMYGLEEIATRLLPSITVGLLPILLFGWAVRAMRNEGQI